MINLAIANKIEKAKALAQAEGYVELNAAVSDFIATLDNRKQAESSDVFSRLIDVSRTTHTNREKLNTLARVTTISVVLILIASIVLGAFIAGSISHLQKLFFWAAHLTPPVSTSRFVIDLCQVWQRRIHR